MKAETDARVCLGVIVGVHGIRGDVRIKAFTEEPENVAAYGPVSDEPGQKTFRLAVRGVSKGTVVAGVAGVSDRNAAEALKGTKLYVSRDRLPEPEDEETFYHADLVGMDVRSADGTSLGRVTAVFDHGAGDVLDIRRADGKVVAVPFTRGAVPEVNVAGGWMTVAWDLSRDDTDPPDGDDE